MSLSSDLISQFVKATKDNETTSSESIVYGTTVEYDGSIWVQIDGSERYTPVTTTTDMNAGERVTVMIKNHTATVTGNLSSPSARTDDVQELGEDVQEIGEQVSEFETIIADKVDTTYLEAETARIETLIAGKATIENLEATNAVIENLEATKLSAEEAKITYATIENLQATNADIHSLTADVADIDTLIFGSASGSTIQTSFANAVVAQLGDAQIKSAMIESVSANKVTSGSIVTNNVNVVSEDGKLLISDETIQISDDTRVRVQIGKDASGDYSINVWDVNGELMFSEGGITDSAIKEAIIRDDMVSETANISAGKINIDSLFEEINGSSNTISSTKVYLDDEEQTLDIAFVNMTTDVNDITETVSSQGTAISTIQGQISSKIWEQDITTATDELGNSIETLNTQYSSLNQTVDGLSSTVASHTTEIANKADNSTVTTVTDRVASVEQSLDGFKTTVSETYATSEDMANIETRVSTVEQTAWGVSTKVEQNGVISAINQSSEEIQIYASRVDIAGAVTFTSFDSDLQDQITGISNTADSASEDASTAIANASTAIAIASTAQETADTAQETVDTANTNASTALTRSSYHYGTCSTAASTTAKVVTLSGFELYTGAIISVLFTYANTASAPTLNVNGTGAKYIYAYGSTLTSDSAYNWSANAVVSFIYSGSHWRIVDSAALSKSAEALDLADACDGTLSAWCVANDRTYINGGVIGTATLSADAIYGGTISGVTINVDTDITVGNALKLGGGGYSTTTVKSIQMNDTNTWIYTSGDGLRIDTMGDLYLYSSYDLTLDANSIDFTNATIKNFNYTPSISISSSGSGNCITGLSYSSGTLTATKAYRVASHTSTGSGNAVTGITLSGGVMTVTYGSTFATTSALSSYLPLSGGTMTGKIGMKANIAPITTATYYNGGSGTRWYYVYATNVVCTTLSESDERLKENIVDLDTEKCVKLINGIDVKNFNFIDNPDQLKMGIIAQDLIIFDHNELEDTFTDSFIYVDPEDEDKILTVDYNQFISPLIVTVQEQQKQIDEQETRITQLEEMLASLQEQINELKS